MRILAIGGTVFVGRHFVEVAAQNGHEVTLFHRGVRGRDLFPELEHVLGDRDGQISNLGDRHWDAVVDFCGYVPRVVARSADWLSERAGRYLYVSSVSVYADSSVAGQDESAEVGILEDPTVETIDGETYGPLKALCEEVVRERFGRRGLVVRPGLIVGPYDPTNRFPYWVENFATRGRVLVPDRPEQPLQMIDARDLGAFMLSLLVSQAEGTFNAVGEERTLADMVSACQTLQPDSKSIWTSEEEVSARGLELWKDLPLVLPFDGSADGMNQMSNRKAIDQGLSLRHWDETAADTWDWLQTQPSDRPRPYGAKRVDV